MAIFCREICFEVSQNQRFFTRTIEFVLVTFTMCRLYYNKKAASLLNTATEKSASEYLELLESESPEANPQKGTSKIRSTEMH